MACDICIECIKQGDCDEYCAAMYELLKIQRAQDTKDKTAIIRKLAHRLGLPYAERSDEMRRLGEKLIRRRAELAHLRGGDIRIGYVMSHEVKHGERPVLGTCRKISEIMKAWLPYDFVVTFYEYQLSGLNDNQKQVLMLHELMHIEIGPKGPKIRPHDIEDFRSILKELGIDWSTLDNRDVPDILVGRDGEQDGKDALEE